MKKILIVLGMLLISTVAQAQTSRNPCYLNGQQSTNGIPSCESVSTTRPLPVTATLSGFNQESVLTPFTATTGGVTSGSFTAGKAIVVTNVGSTNIAYCQLGASATTAGQPIAPSGGWFAFKSIAETQVTCATSTSTSLINVSVGTGLPTGTGGGSGGGGGGGAATIADGADITQGAIADAVVAAGAAGTVEAKLRRLTTDFGALLAQMTAVTAGADNVSNTATGSLVYSRMQVFDGATWDRFTGAVTQSGTWTMQPGNTANTTPWLTTITQGGNSAVVKAANTVAPTDVGVVVAVANTLDPGQATMALSSPVVLPSNQSAMPLWGHGVTGAAVPANATYFGFNSGGNLTAPSTAAPLPTRESDGTNTSVLDPCTSATKSSLPITLATAAVKVIAVGVSAKKIYVCAINVNNTAADSIAVFEATTATTCATAAVAVVGAGTSVATAATGYNFGANGGISIGNGGFQVMQTSVNANDLCIAQSAATQLTGNITYVTR